jgi:hypothetical protein
MDSWPPSGHKKARQLDAAGFLYGASENHFWLSTQAASFLASASLTCGLAGMGAEPEVIF